MQLTMPKSRHDQQSSERLSVIKSLDADLFAKQTKSFKWQIGKLLEFLDRCFEIFSNILYSLN